MLSGFVLWQCYCVNMCFGCLSHRHNHLPIESIGHLAVSGKEERGKCKNMDRTSAGPGIGRSSFHRQGKLNSTEITKLKKWELRRHLVASSNVSPTNAHTLLVHTRWYISVVAFPYCKFHVNALNIQRIITAPGDKLIISLLFSDDANRVHRMDRHDENKI